MPTDYRGLVLKPLAQKAGGFYIKDKKMAFIKIDNKDYDTEQLSDEAKNQLTNVQLTDQEIKRLQALLAIAQTARNTYAQALCGALAHQGDTIKFN
jgi:K+/H+ antiporter YhaU regulatory subunit KhtT